MPTILVIDDEDSIRMLLRAVLEGAGYTVLEAPNGRAGLKIYREHVADLVITDLAMPEMNGLDLTLELTRLFSNVKIITMSGEQGKSNFGLQSSLGHGRLYKNLSAWNNCKARYGMSWRLTETLQTEAI